MAQVAPAAQAHHEQSPGQHEIDFKYADAMATADNLNTFRFIVRNAAMAHDLHATFMPKPLFGDNGSGMHCHQSLVDKETGENRYGYKFDARQGFARGWSASVNYAEVSDEDYFEDFSGNLLLTSATYLRQEGRVDYSGSWLRAVGCAVRCLSYGKGWVLV